MIISYYLFKYRSMQSLKNVVNTLFAIPTEPVSKIVCPDQHRIIYLCDMASAVWVDEDIPTVSIRTPYIGQLIPANLAIELSKTHCLKLSIHDSPSSDIIKPLQSAWHFMQQHDRILVHCRMGHSRSAAIVVGFLVIEYGLSFQEAYEYVRAVRPSIRINAGFIQQLKNVKFTDFI